MHAFDRQTDRQTDRNLIVKTALHSMQRGKNEPTFTGNGSHSYVCLLLIIIIVITCTYQLCKRQSADTNVLISRYRLSVLVHLYYIYRQRILRTVEMKLQCWVNFIIVRDLHSYSIMFVLSLTVLIVNPTRQYQLLTLCVVTVVNWCIFSYFVSCILFWIKINCTQHYSLTCGSDKDWLAGRHNKHRHSFTHIQTNIFERNCLLLWQNELKSTQKVHSSAETKLWENNSVGLIVYCNMNYLHRVLVPAQRQSGLAVCIHK